MYSYAQTNLQLFNQIRAADYFSEDMRLIADAYQVAIERFGGMFRASGKTFIAHLVGTASILVTQHAKVTVIAAGLVHAAYVVPGASPMIEQRQRVRAALGGEVDDLVARYTFMKWDAANALRIRTGLSGLDLIGRQVVLMRLANELEELLDLGVLYGSDRRREKALFEGADDLLPAIAVELGYPVLATELEAAYRSTRCATIPELLRTMRNHGFRITCT